MKKAKTKKPAEPGAKATKLRDLEPLTGRASKVKAGGRMNKGQHR
jgi:hypothetical protein